MCACQLCFRTNMVHERITQANSVLAQVDTRHSILWLCSVTLGRDCHQRLRHGSRELEKGCYPRGRSPQVFETLKLRVLLQRQYFQSDMIRTPGGCLQNCRCTLGVLQLHLNALLCACGRCEQGVCLVKYNWIPRQGAYRARHKSQVKGWRGMCRHRQPWRRAVGPPRRSTGPREQGPAATRLPNTHDNHAW